MDARPPAVSHVVERGGLDRPVVLVESRWGDLAATWLRLPRSRATEHAHAETQIVVFPFGPIDLCAMWRGGAGDRHERRLPPGSACVIPPDRPHTVDWHGEAEMVSLYLTPAFITAIGNDLVRGEAPAPAERYGDRDPVLFGLAAALAAELRHGERPSRLQVEAIAAVVAAHLLRSGGRLPGDGRSKPALEPARLRRIADYVEAHLGDDVTLADLAAVAGLSPYHFTRAFKAAVGVTPYQFVIERRVARAGALLVAGHASVAQIAAATGFTDQSHLARHFRRLLGVSPRQFAKDRRIVPIRGTFVQDGPLAPP